MCTLSLVAANPPSSAQTSRPNIIFIMADDLGYGDLGCYGQREIQTPQIDALAKNGMRFTQFYAGSTVCAPSRCCLMTGLHTGHCFIRGNGKDNLRPEDVVVAEIAKAAGYATGLFGKWGLGHEGSSGLPTRQGFDHFFGYLDQHHAHNYYPSFLVLNENRFPLANVVPEEGQWGQGVATEKQEYSHDLINAAALDFIERYYCRPFFLYLAYTIPHANNEAQNRGMEVPDYGQYAERDWPEPQKGHAAMITRMDTDIGRIMDRLRTCGILDNTIVIFTSDNGPHREGGNDPDFNDSNGALTGIKRSLHEGGIRVPLIASGPGHIPAGAVSDHVGAFWDVLPTVADLVGAKHAVPHDLDGISFAPSLLGRPAEQRQHDDLFWVFYEGQGARALRWGEWKAIEQPLYTPLRLYDLESDIGEQHDLASDQPEIVAHMRKRMDESYTPSARWQLPKPKPAK